MKVREKGMHRRGWCERTGKKNKQKRTKADQGPTTTTKGFKKEKNADALTGSLLLQWARMRTRKRDKDGP